MWEQPWGEGLEDVGWWKAQHEPTMCARSPEGQPSPGLHKKQCSQQVKGGDSAPLIWWDPTGSPASSSGALSTGQTRTFCSGARQDHKNDRRAGTPPLWGKAKRVGAVQPGEEEASRWPYSSLSVREGAYKKAGEGLFTRARSDRRRSNGFKLKEGRFRLDIRKKFFTLRVVRHWHRLPREAVGALSLEVFKARLDGSLSNLVQWKVYLSMAGGLERDDL